MIELFPHLEGHFELIELILDEGIVLLIGGPVLIEILLGIVLLLFLLIVLWHILEIEEHVIWI